MPALVFCFAISAIDCYVGPVAAFLLPPIFRLANGSAPELAFEAGPDFARPGDVIPPACEPAGVALETGIEPK